MTLVTTDFRVKFDQMGKISLMRVEGQLTDESLPELYEVSRRYSDAIDARVRKGYLKAERRRGFEERETNIYRYNFPSED